MKIAIASGKGGTGKTMTAVNLAWTAAQQGYRTAYLDCDVEEPNGALYLKPQITHIQTANVPVPVIDANICNSCELCADICRYNALVVLSDQVLVFPELCHGCGGCTLVCPVRAIHEEPRRAGSIESGMAGDIAYVGGILRVGESIAPPVVHKVKQSAPDAELTFIDCPPGTACPAVESVKDADFVLLVSEATPFGRHDLSLAIELAKALDRPYAVFLNRANLDDGETRAWCEENGHPILMELDENRQIAETCSRGELIVQESEEMRGLFEKLFAALVQTIKSKQTSSRERVQAWS